MLKYGWVISNPYGKPPLCLSNNRAGNAQDDLVGFLPYIGDPQEEKPPRALVSLRSFKALSDLAIYFIPYGCSRA